jgi:hypothetical protein
MASFCRLLARLVVKSTILLEGGFETNLAEL